MRKFVRKIEVSTSGCGEVIPSCWTPCEMQGIASADASANFKNGSSKKTIIKQIQISRGCGEIGRRAGLRIQWETVGVQVPSSAPDYMKMQKNTHKFIK